MAEAQTNKTPFNLTEKALTQLSFLSAGRARNQHLQIALYNGGCKGISYDMEFVSPNTSLDGYRAEQLGGMTVRYREVDIPLLEGLQIDFSDHLVQGGFKFLNPNAKSTCGCGKSFGV